MVVVLALALAMPFFVFFFGGGGCLPCVGSSHDLGFWVALIALALDRPQLLVDVYCIGCSHALGFGFLIPGASTCSYSQIDLVRQNASGLVPA